MSPAIPPESSHVLADGLRAAVRDGSLGALLGGGREVQIAPAAPHRVFVASVADLASAPLLEAARPSGWQYVLVRHGDAVATARLAAGEGGASLKLSQVSRGALAEAVAEAITVAAGLDSVQAADYELRLLEVPAAAAAALWLHAESGRAADILLPLQRRSKRIARLAPSTAEDFEAALRRDLKRRPTAAPEVSGVPESLGTTPLVADDATPPETDVLPFLIQQQAQANWCWAAVGASVSGYFNPATTWTQCLVVCQQFGVPTCCADGSTPQCNRTGSAIDALKLVGNYDIWLPTDADWDDIVEAISKNNPLVAGFVTGTDGHVMVIYGFTTPDVIYVADPLTGYYATDLTSFVPPGTQWIQTIWTQP